jgi:hypothetical protein
MTHQFRKIAVLSAFVVLTFPTVASFAQEATPKANSTPEGLGLLLLLIGLSAIGLVGLTIYGRMMPVRAGNFDMDDDELIRDNEE